MRHRITFLEDYWLAHEVATTVETRHDLLLGPDGWEPCPLERGRLVSKLVTADLLERHTLKVPTDHPPNTLAQAGQTVAETFCGPEWLIAVTTTSDGEDTVRILAPRARNSAPPIEQRNEMTNTFILALDGPAGWG